MVDLRTYVFLDSLQSQLAAFIGTTAKGFLPIAGVSSLYVEIAPGIAINQVLDVALKNTSVAPAMLVVERAFGLLEVHSDDKGQVMRAGEAILEHLGLEENQRQKPSIVTDQVIRSVEPYHSQLINRIRYGSMLIPGHSLFMLETVPAGYITFAANEAEKAADVYLIDMKPFGAFGRLYLGGPESEIDSAREAALAKIATLDGVTNK